MSAQAAPFAILSDIAKRSRSLASGLPAQEEAVELWNGIGFSLDGQLYVAPMGEVVEILHPPRYTQVPGVRNFMVGISNVRGRLLPLVDLSLLLGFPRSSRSQRDRRILIVERGDLFSGLIVDSVLGMQYFSAGSFRSEPTETPAAVRDFVRGSYSRDEEEWKVFSTFRLIEDDRFLDVAQW